MTRIWVDFIFSIFNLTNSQTLNQNTLYFTVFCNGKSKNVVAVTLLYRTIYNAKSFFCILIQFQLNPVILFVLLKQDRSYFDPSPLQSTIRTAAQLLQLVRVKVINLGSNTFGNPRAYKISHPSRL